MNSGMSIGAGIRTLVQTLTPGPVYLLDRAEHGDSLAFRLPPGLCVCLVAQSCPASSRPVDCEAHQALFMGFSWQDPLGSQCLLAVSANGGEACTEPGVSQALRYRFRSSGEPAAQLSQVADANSPLIFLVVHGLHKLVCFCP